MTRLEPARTATRAGLFFGPIISRAPIVTQNEDDVADTAGPMRWLLPVLNGLPAASLTAVFPAGIPALDEHAGPVVEIPFTWSLFAAHVATSEKRSPWTRGRSIIVVGITLVERPEHVGHDMTPPAE